MTPAPEEKKKPLRRKNAFGGLNHKKIAAMLDMPPRQVLRQLQDLERHTGHQLTEPEIGRFIWFMIDDRNWKRQHRDSVDYVNL